MSGLLAPCRRNARGAMCSVAAAITLAAWLAPNAQAESGPAWKITSVPSPTVLVPIQDETQELVVKAQEGSVGMLFSSEAVGFHLVFFSPTISAHELQEKLEEALGAGNAEVTGGPGDLSGSKPYVIKITGALAGEQVVMFAEGIFPNETESLTLNSVQEGRSGGEVRLTAVNVGDTATNGSPITITDALPSGLTAASVRGFNVYAPRNSERRSLSCSSPPVLTCTYAEHVPSGDQLIVQIKVHADTEGSLEGVNEASVSGGGAEFPASSRDTFTVGHESAGFGIAQGSVIAASSLRQAGAHPNVTTSFQMNTADNLPFVSAGNPKDIRFNMPPGLVGNAVGMPRCPSAHVLSMSCPRDTIVGVATTFLEGEAYIPGGNELNNWGPLNPEVNPVYNIAPSPGEPVAFEYPIDGATPVRLDTSVLSGGNYGVRIGASGISEAIQVISSTITIWGVPADHQAPGPISLIPPLANEGAGQEGLGNPLSSASRVPLLSNPSQCSVPLVATIEADSWRDQDVFDSFDVPMGSLTGCDQLAMSASISMLPDTLEAGEPAGYSLALHVPRANDPDGLDAPDVRRVVTTLPMGTVVSPSAAWGLNACTDGQFGLHSGVPGDCPREAQVGTLTVKTPALAEAFSGRVYLAAPDCSPCSPTDAEAGTMVRLLVEAEAEGRSNIIVKLEGKASINQQTGQITATFDENPQLPFEDFKLTLGGGSRATLANPRACGAATTTMDLTPWSTPFASDVFPSSTFEINQDCFGPQFKPSFVAGTANIQAGEYTPFTLSFGRSDSDEFLNGLQMQMPPGLLGSLAGIPLCKEPQAAAGTCGSDSLIGHTQVLTGPGPTPFLVTGGQVFLTEGYKGAPFGLSIVVPAKAGPYTLSGTTGRGTVVVRAAINIDPHTAALTITSDPLPTVLDGIPLQLRVVNVTIDRPGFTFNPTSCAKMAITGTLTSRESAGVSVSSPFQATNCAGLGFNPQFKVSTSGHTSKAEGASLDAKLTYPLGPKLANIAKVKVELPKRLPSRLTTLQQACPAAKFDANPSGCPPASVVGIARANTPILPVPLTGPVYFVSHGGEAFPSLIVALQGYGVRVDLVGSTFISEGVTSSTFEQVPDVPINSFELYLPQGPYSALAANGNLCTSTLTMPTTFTAQNGMTLHQATPIAITGCTKAAKAKRARWARAARHRHEHRHAARQGTRHASNRRSN